MSTDETETGLRGFGSVSNDERDKITLKRDSAGDQLCFRMSMQIPPRSEMFMWYILPWRVSANVLRGNETDLPCLESHFWGGKSVDRKV